MNIIIIDDDPLVTIALQTMIEAQNIKVLATGTNGLEAIELYERHHPDVVLMDIRMAKSNGVEASEVILKKYPHAKILFLATFSDDEYILKAIRLGVKGYILKQNFESIVTSLQAVASGQHVFNTEIIEKIPDLLSQISKTSVFDQLTPKEIQFMTLVAQGLNNKEIAAKLYLSEGTIRNYLSALLDKLDLRDRTQLAIYYFQHIQK